MSVMGFRQVSPPYWGPIWTASNLSARDQELVGEVMRRVLKGQGLVLRHLVVLGFALLSGLGTALAQSGDSRAQDQSGKPAGTNAQPADGAKENQRRTDECAEAAQAMNGAVRSAGRS